MSRILVLTVLAAGVYMAGAAPARDEEPVVKEQVQEQGLDPGKPTEALKVFEKKPTAEEKKNLDAANPDPWRASVPIVAGGAAALVLPFVGWFAYRRLKDD